MAEQFKEARAQLVDFMKKQLIGPSGGEKEELKDVPYKRYLMGILFPQAVCVDKIDDHQHESSKVEALNNDFKPSSMAMSFAANTDTVLELQVKAGKYQRNEQGIAWQRTDLEYWEKIRITDSSKKDIFEGVARLDVSVRPYANGKIVTIALSNKIDSGERLEPNKCLYQCALAATVIEGSINEYPSSDRFKLDDEQKELDLTYRKRVPWVVGHGVAAEWELGPDGLPTVIRTESMPTHEVKDFSTDIDTVKYPELSVDI
ncbi:MAG: helicase-related protein, partial [Enterovibrio sp.]